MLLPSAQLIVIIFLCHEVAIGTQNKQCGGAGFSPSLEPSEGVAMTTLRNFLHNFFMLFRAFLRFLS